MIFLKAGVSLDKLTPQALFGMVVLDQILESKQRDLVVTSAGQEVAERQPGAKQIHKFGSLHYSGRAFDFRTSTLPSPASVQDVIAMARIRLGPEFDVVMEADHGHVEYDPKWESARG